VWVRPDWKGQARIYKRDPLVPVIVSGLFLLASISVLYAVAPMAVAAVAAGPVVLAWVPIALEFRRRIVLSPSEFEYRWRSGKVVKIDVAEIMAVEECKEMYGIVPWRPIPVFGLRIIMKNGEVRSLPLDFPDREEIFARLRDLVPSGSGSKKKSYSVNQTKVVDPGIVNDVRVNWKTFTSDPLGKIR
jgi:hypothetical protein